MAKITLIGMTNYDDSFWDALTVPENVDKDTLINNIILEYGELETLYADPSMMFTAIKWWSSKQQWSMDRAMAALLKKYDPLNNYDRTETRNRTVEEGETTSESRTSNSNTSSSSSASSETESESSQSSTGQATETVSAYNSSAYSPKSRTDTTGSQSDIGSGSATTTGSNAGTENTSSNASGDRDRDLTETESVRAYGNIGVTTSQQMLQSELDIAMYNYYNTFAYLFAEDLLIMVY